MTSTLFTTDAKPGRPYWWEDGAPMPELPETPPQRADLAIIGAGYTGLSAAIAAADAGASVVVIDAGVPGEGASSRNGGMFGAHPRLPFETVVSQYGEETARGIYGEANVAFEFTRGLIEREQIACDFQKTGRIQLAWTKAHLESQKKLVKSITSVADIDMKIVARGDLDDHIATQKFFGGILFPGHAAVQPRKFHDGLLDAALRRGVTVCATCPAEAIRPDAGEYLIRTPNGEVRAQRVVMATNGYTQGRFGWFRRRVFPLPSYLIATDPLPTDLIARLAPGGHMMVETRARHSYFRVSPDGSRILYGGRAAIVPIKPEKAAERLHATMSEVWPELSEVKLSHVWSGNTGYSFGHMPHVGRQDGMHYALGYSGSGVALAPYLGMKAAYQALGDERGATAYSDTVLASRPFHIGGYPWFLEIADRWYRHVVDRQETAQSSKDSGH